MTFLVRPPWPATPWPSVVGRFPAVSAKDADPSEQRLQPLLQRLAPGMPGFLQGMAHPGGRITLLDRGDRARHRDATGLWQASPARGARFASLSANLPLGPRRLGLNRESHCGGSRVVVFRPSDFYFKKFSVAPVKVGGR